MSHIQPALAVVAVLAAGCAPPSRSAPASSDETAAVAAELDALSQGMTRGHEATFRSILENALASDGYTCLPSPRRVFFGSGEGPEGDRRIVDARDRGARAPPPPERSGIEGGMPPPLPQSGLEWLDRFARTLRLLHVDVDLAGEDAIAMLRLQGGEAVTIADDTGATILFSSKEPTASAVLEELAHALQHHKERFSDRDVREMRCLREIEAKECLVARASSLGIPPEEDGTTRRQLDEERAILEGLRWR